MCALGALIVSELSRVKRRSSLTPCQPGDKLKSCREIGKYDKDKKPLGVPFEAEKLTRANPSNLGRLRRREAEMENRGRESRLLGSAVLLLWDEFPGYT